MFWSKIWFFLVGAAAVLGIGVALTMPRPAEREVLRSEDDHLVRARWETEILLRENAREWINLASDFARAPAPSGQPRLKLDAVLDEASKGEKVADGPHATARETLQYILSQVSGAQKPEFVIAVDSWGRVVARVGPDDKTDKDYGDDLSGYFLVRDALRGYLRDDLWYMGDKLYRVAAAPVIERSREAYVGAVILGDEVDLTLATALHDRVGADVGFFVRGQPVAVSSTAPITKDITSEYAKHRGDFDKKDDKGRPVALSTFSVSAGEQTFQVAVKRLPGEAGAQDGFFAVFKDRPRAVGFLGTLRAVTKDDISYAAFPWLRVMGGFLIAIILGMVLMWMESDKPLRRLLTDAVALGKGDSAKLTEETHKGKHGSIARSVNIALEKLARDAKAAKKDLGAVLGPPPDEGGIFGSGARPLPAKPPAGGPFGGGGGGAFSPPQPSDFSFEPPPPLPGPGMGMGPIKPQAPMHLSPEPPARQAGGGGGGAFDFDMPGSVATPPPMPRAPSLSTPPPAMVPRMAPPIPPSTPYGPPPPISLPPARQTRAIAAAVPPPLPPPAMATPPPPPPFPPPTLPPGRAVTPNPGRAQNSIPPPSLAMIDDDILAGSADDELISAASRDREPEDPIEALRRPQTGRPATGGNEFGSPTVVADPSATEDLIRQMAGPGDDEATYFRQVYEDFVALKRKCGENVEGLTYEKFSVKLRQNRDQLVAKYNCKAVKFQVYVKDGKAALKATPVKA